MCIVDEASAVPDIVYEAAEGTMSTPGSIFIMISNPTRLSGYFYNSHNRLKHQWQRYHVTSFDSSRVDQKFVDKIAETYGESSDQYRVKVLGEFPTAEEEALISPKVVRAAFDREIAEVYDDVTMGLDVGRGGDLSALVVRKGNVVVQIGTKDYKNTMETVGWAKEVYDDLTDSGTIVSAIYVDSIGIGAGVADRLRDLGLPSVDVNVSETPSMKGQYLRLRDELWYNVKEWLEGMSCSIRGLSIKEQDMVEAELSSPLAKFTSSGKNAVESKSEMKKRGYKSPNIADALCLTFAYQGSVAAGRSSGKGNAWNKPIEFSGAAHVY
jgi:hypothetical protein